MDRRKLISLGLVVVVLFSVLGGGYFWYVKKNGEPDFFFPAVEVTEVRRGSIVRRLTVVGLLLADQKVDIKPEVRGKISKINFEEGT